MQKSKHLDSRSCPAERPLPEMLLGERRVALKNSKMPSEGENVSRKTPALVERG